MTSAVEWKAECRAQAVEWAARLESFMPVPPDQRPELDKEWKAFCVDERARWLETHDEPFECDYLWNPHWFFDDHRRWVQSWFEHIERVGDAWLAERGLRVAEWHSRRGEGLRIVPITQGPAPAPTVCSRSAGPADYPTHAAT